jgi:predicted  nucleic acid-binding Zn-ribbon protein
MTAITGSEGVHVLDVLERLLELAAIDEDIADMREESSHLPQRERELETQKDELAGALREREAELEELTKSRAHEERDLEDEKARLEALKRRQLEIKTNEEYAALIQEIKYAERRIGETEDRILQMLEDGEALDRAVEEARKAMDESSEALDAELAEVRAEIGKVDERLEVRLDERRRVAMHLDPVVLGRYERILQSKGDSALAPLDGDTCSGCYVKLPPQTVIEVRKARRLIECESCGRILCCVPEGSDGPA